MSLLVCPAGRLSTGSGADEFSVTFETERGPKGDRAVRVMRRDTRIPLAFRRTMPLHYDNLDPTTRRHDRTAPSAVMTQSGRGVGPCVAPSQLDQRSPSGGASGRLSNENWAFS